MLAITCTIAAVAIVEGRYPMNPLSEFNGINYQDFYLFFNKREKDGIFKF